MISGQHPLENCEDLLARTRLNILLSGGQLVDQPFQRVRDVAQFFNVGLVMAVLAEVLRARDKDAKLSECL